ncbi:MAG: hypothetical protein HY619_04045 [Thaumarchaeota archaeon]|nr:hypothetical protein [Nitrososphaerota archaeon]
MHTFISTVQIFPLMVTKMSMKELRLNVRVFGEPAKMILEMQKRGLIRDYSDAINQAIPLLFDKVLERDLKVKQRGWQIGKEPGSG